jgi:hypothetical protein
LESGIYYKKWGAHTLDTPPPPHFLLLDFSNLDFHALAAFGQKRKEKKKLLRRHTDGDTRKITSQKQIGFPQGEINCGLIDGAFAMEKNFPFIYFG